MQPVRPFIGMDVHKATIPISVAEDGRNGPVPRERVKFHGVYRYSRAFDEELSAWQAYVGFPFGWPVSRW